MGKTHAARMKGRDERLGTLPRKARYAKSAEIKRREGRVLDSNEKRAVKMKGQHGALMRAWEVLRASADAVDEKLEAMRQQAKLHGAIDADPADLADDGEVTAGKSAANAGSSNKGRTLLKEDFDMATGRREAAVEKTLAQLKPKFDELARTPTASRVIQSCIKFGTNEQRAAILLLFTPNFTQYCTDGFAHFAIEALIRHATKSDFKSIMNLSLNVMNSLATHKCGMRVVNALYNHKLCSATEKHMLVLGIFKDNVAVMKSWQGFPVLEDILKYETTHRKRLLSVLFEATDKLVSQKEAFDFPFVQRLLYAVFARGTREQVEELAATIKPHLVAMTASKDGAKLASVALGILPPRARKAVLQDVTKGFSELVMGKFSPPFLARCFDLTYDPQMAHKHLAGPLCAEIGPASGSPYGCRLLLHLLTPDAERKDKVMLPGYQEHNLYSRGNPHWNHHTWCDDATLEEETVEICPKSAEESHRVVLGAIMSAFVETVCKVKGLTDNKTLKGFVARIAAEAVHLIDTEPKYKQAMDLNEEQVTLLRSLMSNKDRTDEDATAARAATAAIRNPSGKPATPAEVGSAKKSQQAAAATPASAARRASGGGEAIEASPAAVTASAKRGRPSATPATATAALAAATASATPARKSTRPEGAAAAADVASPRSASKLATTTAAAATPAAASSSKKKPAVVVTPAAEDDDAPVEVSARGHDDDDDDVRMAAPSPKVTKGAAAQRASSGAARTSSVSVAATPAVKAETPAAKKGGATAAAATPKSAIKKEAAPAATPVASARKSATSAAVTAPASDKKKTPRPSSAQPAASPRSTGRVPSALDKL